MRETLLRKSIVEYLSLSGYFAIPMNTMGVPMKNGRWRPAQVTGVPDILFWGKGKSGGIECKIAPNKPTANQLAFGEKLIAAGGIYLLAYSLNDIVDFLE